MGRQGEYQQLSVSVRKPCAEESHRMLGSMQESKYNNATKTVIQMHYQCSGYGIVVAPRNTSNEKVSPKEGLGITKPLDFS